MGSRGLGRLATIGLLAGAAAGCATGTNERMSMLEEANRLLGARLNRAGSDLEAARQEQQALDRRLAAALAEADRLRDDLANQPVPETTAPGWTAVPGGAMIAIDADVLFAPGRIALRDESRRALDGVVSTLQGQYSDKDVLVLGHTDNQPIKKSGWHDNYQLSTERALAVVRHLKEHGVETQRLIAAGCGEFRPRGSNASETGRSHNRRVEIFAINPVPQAAQP